MIKVLFVCLGNICRSPMAEFVFKDIVNKKGLSKEFKTNYGLTDKSFSTVSNSTSQPTFPFVYVKSMFCCIKRWG